MKTKRFGLILLIIVLPLVINAQVVKTGIEVLKESNFKQLAGKRVGLITNPTGVDNSLKSTADILFEAKEVNLVALFGPEHGIRGNAHAGDKVQDQKDEATGLPLFSLYGSTRKATPEMLKGIDVLVYDIQDIGSRSFTYISSMGLAMEAAAENGIEFMVLDRPNPLGGERVEGLNTQDGFISFVSQFKIPYIYGLTSGELAQFLNEEGMLKSKCKLSVIKMKGWKRDMIYTETGLEWIPSSPHVPHPFSPFYYALSGILGELYYVSIGVGYTTPFQIFAAEWIDPQKFAQKMNSYGLKGVYFRPIYIKPYYSTSANKNIAGVQVHIKDYKRVVLTDIQFLAMEALHELYPEKSIFENASTDRFRMFDQVCGSDSIRIEFSKRYKFEDVKNLWYKDVESFKKSSKPYLLY